MSVLSIVHFSKFFTQVSLPSGLLCSTCILNANTFFCLLIAFSLFASVQRQAMSQGSIAILPQQSIYYYSSPTKMICAWRRHFCIDPTRREQLLLDVLILLEYLSFLGLSIFSSPLCITCLFNTFGNLEIICTQNLRSST